jgi:hypothetical protein
MQNCKQKNHLGNAYANLEYICLSQMRYHDHVVGVGVGVGVGLGLEYVLRPTVS